MDWLQRFHLPNCSGFVGCLDKWQALEAGVLGFAAAIIVVWMTLRSERRREKREFQALKIAIGSEIRQFALTAIEAHERCAAAIDKPLGMSLHDLEDACRFSIPIIYESNANSVGKFGNCVHELVLFFGNISVLRQTVDRITRTPTRAKILAVTTLNRRWRAFDDFRNRPAPGAPSK